jgi:hypothetical protein
VLYWERYFWQKASERRGERAWMDAAGQPVVYAHTHTRTSRVTLRVEPAASQSADLGLLALLAAYLVIRRWTMAIVTA